MDYNLIDRKWNKYLSDSEKSDYQTRIYVAYFVITVNKHLIDSNVVANLIRAIPNVTTVSKDSFGQETPESFKAFYHVKFVLEPHDDLNTYVLKVLKRGIQDIRGLRINAYRGIEKVEI